MSDLLQLLTAWLRSPDQVRHRDIRVPNFLWFIATRQQAAQT